MLTRRDFIRILGSVLAFTGGPAAAAPVVNVYKNEGCGCCGSWVKHLQKDGLAVKAHNVPDPDQYRIKFGLPDKMSACHTAVVDGYVIQGHVPARELRRLLAERPKAKGLAVPGMPAGSPGMESDQPEPYDVLLILSDGSHRVYARYGR